MFIVLFSKLSYKIKKHRNVTTNLQKQKHRCIQFFAGNGRLWKKFKMSVYE